MFHRDLVAENDEVVVDWSDRPVRRSDGGPKPKPNTTEYVHIFNYFVCFARPPGPTT